MLQLRQGKITSPDDAKLSILWSYSILLTVYFLFHFAGGISWLQRIVPSCRGLCLASVSCIMVSSIKLVQNHQTLNVVAIHVI